MIVIILQDHYSIWTDGWRVIRDAKTRKGITAQDLADISGVSKATVDRYLIGTVAEPKAFNLAALCIALNISMDELFGYNVQRSPESVEVDRLLADKKRIMSYLKFACVLIAVLLGALITLALLIAYKIL